MPGRGTLDGTTVGRRWRAVWIARSREVLTQHLGYTNNDYSDDAEDRGGALEVLDANLLESLGLSDNLEKKAPREASCFFQDC